MPRKLTDQDRRDIVILTAAALTGIAADHGHVRQIKGLGCGQSMAEWAAMLGTETHYRLRAKIGTYEEVMDTPVEKAYRKRISKRTRLYPRSQECGI